MPNSEDFYDQITTSSFSLARFVMHCIWTITKLSRSLTLGNYNSYLLLLTEFSPQQRGNLVKGNDNKTVINISSCLRLMNLFWDELTFYLKKNLASQNERNQKLLLDISLEVPPLVITQLHRKYIRPDYDGTLAIRSTVRSYYVLRA